MASRPQLSCHLLVKPLRIPAPLHSDAPCHLPLQGAQVEAADPCTLHQISYMLVRPDRISSLNAGLIDSSVRASRAAYSLPRSISFAVGAP